MRVPSPLPAGARTGGGPVSVPGSAGGWSAAAAAATRHRTPGAPCRPPPAPAGSPASGSATATAGRSSARGEGSAGGCSFLLLLIVNVIGCPLSATLMKSVKDGVFACPMMVGLGCVCLAKKGVADAQCVCLLHRRAGSNFTKVRCLISSPLFDVSGVQQALVGLQLSYVSYMPQIFTKMNQALRLAVC